ncbi:MAG: bifunctional 2-polyprenyl-6-hydroxyphenol methylase/3-demethylubiquinol 3-O-methyltransferase UbiG [Planctomycetota bacterium]|nr:bifunctional 2-polyprenyl-6-hydroxyphenol methylase/3-demethylubiquinol 3-O-methyltransferase UbiG [Planctomycetota bacterium]
MQNRSVNNAIYEQLGDRWYEADDDPVALLRAESKLRNPWVAACLRDSFGARPVRLLDVGCGGGFLTNYLAAAGHDVTGLDNSATSLAVAARHDFTGRVDYRLGDALKMPFENGSFDVVCALDFLEHVDDLNAAVAEVGRVLALDGLFFFHTFSRNRLCWLVIIKGCEWFVKNTPRDMHVLPLFVDPSELEGVMNAHGMRGEVLRGTRPCFDAAMWRMLRTGIVPREFSFKFCNSTVLGYSGFARKRSAEPV